LLLKSTSRRLRAGLGAQRHVSESDRTCPARPFHLGKHDYVISGLSPPIAYLTLFVVGIAPYTYDGLHTSFKVIGRFASPHSKGTCDPREAARLISRLLPSHPLRNGTGAVSPQHVAAAPARPMVHHSVPTTLSV
jgi:hypothetical protein